ncbi:hypothetical protein FRC01_012346 [Tulasnella sp. 417]|nr:hypothetical protein FRC01_012346 [Tulasnella sp. 417]
MYYVNARLKAREDFVARVWKWRQYRANKAKGLTALPRGPVRGHAAQPPLGPPPPSSLAFQTGATGPQLQQPFTIPPRGAAPSTDLDVEAMGGQVSDSWRKASSDAMTSPAAPPPSARPSWTHPSAPGHRPLS